MPVTIRETLESILPGGWTPYKPPGSSDLQILTSIMGEENELAGVHYRVESVSFQFIAKINYRYKCKASPYLGKNDFAWDAVIEVFQPLEGTPLIVSIQALF